jgi:phosphate transport system ATP-binding protein
MIGPPRASGTRTVPDHDRAVASDRIEPGTTMAIEGTAADRPVTAERIGAPPPAIDHDTARAELAAEAPVRLETRGITVRYGSTMGVRDVDLTFRDKTVTALIGPSGCGKTTFLRSLNRMHDLTRGVTVTGTASLDGQDIYANGVDPVTIRRRIGMVFQKPTPFPTMSIYDNVVAGLKLVGIRDRRLLDEVAERSLRQAALWDEVKDRLNAPASGISGGQQQRLSIARALAVEADVLLMDEPTSSLDPQSTMRIEELIDELKRDVTIIIVTHNMQQAARVSDYTAFFYEGNLIEWNDTNTMFTNPRETRTNDYVTGRFG